MKYLLLLLLVPVFAGCGLGAAQTELRTAIDAKQDALSACYADALGRNGDAAGTLQGWVHVEDKEGKVDTVEFDQADIDDPAFQGCVQSSLTGIQLAAPPAANMKVEYTFQFSPSN